MRWENVFVAGTGVWLGEPEYASAAVESGAYDREQWEADAIESVSVADASVSPPDMAVHAATAALKRSGLDAADVGLLIHSSIWFQGVPMWPSASYVAGHALSRATTAFGLEQECNGGLGALEVAARQIAGGTRAAMVTTADRFGAPLVERWSSEPGFVYGDGGTAVLLSGTGGVARLLATASGSDNALEAVVRGPGFQPLPTAEPLDLLGRVGHYVRARGSVREATERVGAVVRSVVDTVLADAGTDRESIARVVALASGRSRLAWQLPQLLGLPVERSTWEFARRVGHLGAGDQFAALNDLLERRAVGRGERVLLVGGGSGFSCTCAVLEILDVPEWETSGTAG
ncbi:ketoacyl-ACP synthase III family protein [Streptomyces clavuligerus]|uniref:Putative 3-oxoacyl-ACP synthase III n=1 Tax=Streptomyces clavuligerus TaxID=1901 RepID=B5H3R1_STRCL|nr:ketoacyl-ACP synthase III family protein [Streptomyces clavuligerus]ANW21316.1 secondary metabolite biosynthesis protein [Streptomyces clavuligerus]AXU15943.1 secondary metabolite biosynthesis protein [Streptomyces clavuligerus]EDY53207.1 3-oxoacyl-(acyl carrier protein) synthase III [Streptomyces clavuligerus]EFG05560.1 Putative 3-oxoacyl-ACP synthase III [Streptomyces clavuligerus]MBY6306071.1 ketoacyl-ACP synthase III family protein [Streptomyces clavuligerus]